MYTTTRLNTRGCDNVTLNVYNSQTLYDGIEVNLEVTSVVVGANSTHIVSDMAITLTRDQWQDVVCKINNALKETNYANEARV